MTTEGEKFGVTLGRYLRAARLRFGWMPQLHAFMRLSIVADDLFRAEVVPPDQVPSERVDKAKSFVIWYDAERRSEGLPEEMAGVCRRVLFGAARPVRIKRPVAFLFDGDGEFKGWAES